MLGLIVIIILFFLIVLFGYFILAFPIKWWPYERVLTNDSSVQASTKRERNLNIFIAFLIIEFILIIALAVTWILRKKARRFISG